MPRLALLTLEQAAVVEHDSGLPRERAEAAALEEVRQMMATEERTAR
jgi:hypothetical protein